MAGPQGSLGFYCALTWIQNQNKKDVNEKESKTNMHFIGTFKATGLTLSLLLLVSLSLSLSLPFTCPLSFPHSFSMTPHHSKCHSGCTALRLHGAGLTNCGHSQRTEPPSGIWNILEKKEEGKSEVRIYGCAVKEGPSFISADLTLPWPTEHRIPPTTHTSTQCTD